MDGHDLDHAFVHERERELAAADGHDVGSGRRVDHRWTSRSSAMDPGQTKTLTFTITGEGLAPNAQYFGSIKLDPKAAGANDIYLPVAFFTRQGDVTLTQTCAPGSIAVNALEHLHRDGAELLAVRCGHDDQRR